MLFAEGSVCGEPGQFDKHGGRCQGVPQPHALRLGCLHPLHEDCRLLHEEYVSVISHSLSSYVLPQFISPETQPGFGSLWGGGERGSTQVVYQDIALRSGHDEPATKGLKFDRWKSLRNLIPSTAGVIHKLLIT